MAVQASALSVLTYSPWSTQLQLQLMSGGEFPGGECLGGDCPRPHLTYRGKTNKTNLLIENDGFKDRISGATSLPSSPFVEYDCYGDNCFTSVLTAKMPCNYR